MEEDMEFVEGLCYAQGITLPAHYDRGGFVGVANITGCVTDSKSPWFEGPYGFLISDARPIPFHPYRGLLNLWEVSDFTPPEPSKEYQPLARITPRLVIKVDKPKGLFARLFDNSGLMRRTSTP
jgi:hypothetical protein